MPSVNRAAKRQKVLDQYLATFLLFENGHLGRPVTAKKVANVFRVSRAAARRALDAKVTEGHLSKAVVKGHGRYALRGQARRVAQIERHAGPPVFYRNILECRHYIDSAEKLTHGRCHACIVPMVDDAVRLWRAVWKDK